MDTDIKQLCRYEYFMLQIEKYVYIDIEPQLIDSTKQNIFI